MNTDKPDHHGSHRRLLWDLDCPTYPKRSLDAIIVPTARRPHRLSEAAELAVALGCTLVTLHSGKCTSASKAQRELPGQVDLIAIDVPKESRLNMPRWEVTRLLEGTVFAQRSDLWTSSIPLTRSISSGFSPVISSSRKRIRLQPSMRLSMMPRFRFVLRSGRLCC